MIHRLRLTILCGLLAALAGCDATPPAVETTLTGRTMGTTWSVKIAALPDGVGARELQGEIDAALEAVNAQMSTYRADSELSRFNAGGLTDWSPVSPATAQVVAEAQRISQESGGAFDATVMPLVNLWSFGPEARPDAVPTDAELTGRRKQVGFQKLDVRLDPAALKKADPRMAVDLSAIAKGYGVDVVAALLKSRSVAGSLVEIGGEVRATGRKADGSAWRVGIEKPIPGRRALERVVELSDAAMATSGDYRNYFEERGVRYSHTIDPRTGRPITHALASVSVIADSCMTADGYATAVMVLGPDAGYDWLVERDLPALLIVKQGDAFVERPTPAFAAQYSGAASEPVAAAP